MQVIINGFDFWNMEAMKYFAPSTSWSAEKKKENAEQKIFSGSWLAARKRDGIWMMFIKDMISDKSMQNGQSMSRTSIILHNLINMMNELGLEPITEGVETEEQYHILTQMGSRMFQGYLFAKPIPVEDFEKQFLHEAANPEKTA